MRRRRTTSSCPWPRSRTPASSQPTRWSSATQDTVSLTVHVLYMVYYKYCTYAPFIQCPRIIFLVWRQINDFIIIIIVPVLTLQLVFIKSLSVYIPPILLFSPFHFTNGSTQPTVTLDSLNSKNCGYNELVCGPLFRPGTSIWLSL